MNMTYSNLLLQTKPWSEWTEKTRERGSKLKKSQIPLFSRQILEVNRNVLMVCCVCLVLYIFMSCVDIGMPGAV